MDNPDQIWSGEKMLVIPSLIDESLDRDRIVNLFGRRAEKNYGIASLVSSFSKTEQYLSLDSLIVKTEEIGAIVNYFKKGNFNQTVVFANRYDGIDLPDESCRILIIDGKPFFNSLADRYEENNRQDSDSINVKIAQKIEQGLGRSVRGEKDYSLILIIGADLIKFSSFAANSHFYNPGLQKVHFPIKRGTHYYC